MVGSPSGERLGVALTAIAIALIWLASHGMYRTAVGNVRVGDVAHLYEAGAFSAVAANMVDSHLGVHVGAFGLIAGAVATGFVLQWGRVGFRAAVYPRGTAMVAIFAAPYSSVLRTTWQVLPSGSGRRPSWASRSSRPSTIRIRRRCPRSRARPGAAP